MGNSIQLDDNRVKEKVGIVNVGEVSCALAAEPAQLGRALQHGCQTADRLQSACVFLIKDLSPTEDGEPIYG